MRLLLIPFRPSQRIPNYLTGMVEAYCLVCLWFDDVEVGFRRYQVHLRERPLQKPWSVSMQTSR